jgi:hypothetical protein
MMQPGEEKLETKYSIWQEKRELRVSSGNYGLYTDDLELGINHKNENIINMKMLY